MYLLRELNDCALALIPYGGAEQGGDTGWKRGVSNLN
jgi:hypothetical protein